MAACNHKSPDCCCPFAETVASEYVQGLGCLPSGFDIIVMARDHGRTWACHGDPDKPCVGALRELKRRGIEHKPTRPYLTEADDWAPFTKTS